MVSIRKAKEGFQIRRRGAGGLSQPEKEKLGLVVLAGMCVGVLLLVVLLTSGGGTTMTSYDLDGGAAAGGGGGANQGARGRGNNPFRNRKPHPQLVIQEEEEDGEDLLGKLTPLQQKQQQQQLPPQQGAASKQKTRKESFVSDALNAMALDILQTLDCDKLFEKTIQQLKGGGGGGDWNRMDDAEPIGANREHRRRRRRRLEQNQHGDDGEFDVRGDNDLNGGAGAAADTNIGDADEKDDNTAEEPEDEKTEKWGRDAMGNADMMNRMDDAAAFDFREDDFWKGGYRSATGSAKHLFCLAAMQEPPSEIVSMFSCAATGNRRKPILDLWTSARAQISDMTLLLKVLELSEEHKYQEIMGRKYNLWAPHNDKGMTFMINTLKNELLETLNSLEPSLGPGKLFVDVGSGMGLTTLAILEKYPGTKIVSIEPASPNWLLQELNIRCNLSKNEHSKIKVVLAGVGPNTDDEDNMMAKLMWRPTSTTSSRAWTPAEEFGPDDVELLIRLRKLRSILAEADVSLIKDGSSTPNMMDVLNLDCQGCEYNLIPALSEEEFDAIPNVMGNVHWGYIPLSKLPSSKRGKETHDRLCQHETIASTTKECCGSLNVPVKSNVPGEVLYRDNGEDHRAEGVTVSDIIMEGLCDDYEAWAAEHHVNDVQEDWGWFELSSKAQ